VLITRFCQSASGMCPKRQVRQVLQVQLEQVQKSLGCDRLGYRHNFCSFIVAFSPPTPEKIVI
jgi:hypothetical protein